MKRTGFRLLYVFTLIGIFILPSKALATVDQTTFQGLEDSITTNLKNVDIGSADKGWADSIIKSVQSDTEWVYSTEKNDANLTILQLEQDVYTKIIDDLNQWSQNQDPNAGDSRAIAQKYLAVINPLYTKARTTLEVKNGTITTDQQKQYVNTSITNAQNLSIQASKALKGDETKGKCSFSNIGACVDDFFSWLIKHTLLEIAGFLLWVTANMLNYAISISILNFANWAPDTLYPIWVLVRQIVSLFIVFAGLYLGIMYILGEEKRFEKYIPWVVIFALFVNFSYPITRTLVDVSNVISLRVYSAAVGSGTLDGNGSNSAGALIMSRLGLQGLVMSATKEKTTISSAAGNLTDVGTTAGALMAVAFVLYAAYIFFMVTALIITRTAVLVFIIIASPILLVDSVLPALGDQAVKIRKVFFEQLLVGPFFMIMLALTLKFLEVFSKASAAGKAGMNTTVVEFFNILMMLIMLHLMYKITKHYAGEAGQMATKAMGKVGGFAMGAASAGTGILARQSLGRLAVAARDSNWMESNQTNFLGRRAYEMSNSVAKSSFDLRNSSVIAGQAQKIGMGMGMGSKSGLEERIETRDKKRVEIASRIGTHKKNVYEKDKDGNLKLKFKKGDVDIDDEEAKQRRKDYIDNAGGSIFTLNKNTQAQEESDLKYSLQQANKKQVKDVKSGEVATIGELDREKDKAQIDALFDKYKDDFVMTARLKDAYKKKITDDYTILGDNIEKKKELIEKLSKPESGDLEKGMVDTLSNLDAKNALSEYKALPSTAAKEKYKSTQSPETVAAIEEHENKIATKEAADLEAKTKMSTEQANTTAAINNLAEIFKKSKEPAGP